MSTNSKDGHWLLTNRIWRDKRSLSGQRPIRIKIDTGLWPIRHTGIQADDQSEWGTPAIGQSNTEIHKQLTTKIKIICWQCRWLAAAHRQVSTDQSKRGTQAVVTNLEEENRLSTNGNQDRLLTASVACCGTPAGSVSIEVDVLRCLREVNTPTTHHTQTGASINIPGRWKIVRSFVEGVNLNQIYTINKTSS